MSSNSRHQIPGLQDAPHTGDLQQSQWMQQVTQVVRQGTGQHGDPNEKWLTLKDLENLHVVEQLPGGGYTPGGGGGTGPGDEEPPDTSPPEPLKNLEARGGMTAIRVLWDAIEYSYYYRIEVHKSATDDLGEAFLAGTTQGNIYQDVVGSDTTTWYYWARVVKQVGSITIVGPWNQTEGTPAAAAPDPDWILEDLEGAINDSHLNDNLNREIDKIPEIEKDVGDMEDSIRDIELDISELEEGLNTEITERKDEDEQLHSRITTNVSRIDDNAAAIVTESETRASEDEALARQIETLVAEVDDNRAAIQTESEVRATEDEALASRITTMQVEVDGNKAAIQTESEVRASEDEVLAIRIDTQTARIDDNAAAIQTESEVRADADEALASQITTLAAEVDENSAAIQEESTVRASEDEVLAERITTLRVDMDDASAAIRDEMTVIIDEGQKLASRVQTVELDLEETKGAIETRMEAVENELGEIRLEYTVIIDNDGYAGGFSIINEDGVIAALWRVDIFAVGAPGCESLAFAIDAEENRVVMDGALIKNASITTAQIGELDVERLTGDTAHFVNANITDGSIVNAKIGNIIYSEGYEAGKKGWIINKSGFAEFSDIVARGKIEGSIIRGSVIEGGMLIQSDIQIATPTEADRGPGTIRYLSVVTTREQVAAFEGDEPREAESPVLGIASANYTAEGHQDYGDGEQREPVYNNLNRYLKYTIKPVIFAHAKIHHPQDKRYDINYKFRVIAVGYDNSETDLYTGDAVNLHASQNGWVEGTNSDGTWRAHRLSWENCHDTSCTYHSGVSEAEITVNKRSFNFDASKYKGLKAWFEFGSRATPSVQTISIRDTLSDYL